MSKASNLNFSPFLLLMVGGLAGAWFGTVITERNRLMMKSTDTEMPAGPRVSSTENAFILCINIKFRDIEQKEEFKRIFTPTANYVAKEEYETLSYEIAESDQDPLHAFILERYKSKESFTEIHRKGEIFLEMKKKMAELNFTEDNGFHLSGHSFIETNIGFV
mmetsp:Transcript_26392/g.26642  ORF Transcript_26392/g.26642 Transcript_26392/m.26642 type:complete len:163 (+) Transcript_26392:263-751(+)